MIKYSIMLILGLFSLCIAPSEVLELIAMEDEIFFCEMNGEEVLLPQAPAPITTEPIDSDDELLFERTDEAARAYYAKIDADPRAGTPPTASSTPEIPRPDTTETPVGQAVQALHNKQGTNVGDFTFYGFLHVEGGLDYGVRDLEKHLKGDHANRISQVILRFTQNRHGLIHFRGKHAGNKTDAETRATQILKVMDILSDIPIIQPRASIYNIAAILTECGYSYQSNQKNKGFDIQYDQSIFVSLIPQDKAFRLKIINNRGFLGKEDLLSMPIRGQNVKGLMAPNTGVLEKLVACVKENNDIK